MISNHSKRLATLISLAFILLPSIAWAEDIVLQNDHCKIVFGGDNEFVIKSFEMEGVDIAAPSTTHLWEIELLGPRGENALVKPWDTSYDGGSKRMNSAQFVWRVLLEGSTDYMIMASVNLEPEMELPSFSFDAILPKGWIITKAEYPRIAVKRPADAKVILSAGYGTRYNAPAGGWLHSEYPSCTGAMQMTMMTSPQGTVFFSTRDEYASQKQFFVGGEGDTCIFLQKAIAGYDWTDELGIFQLPWNTVIGFTKDGWEETALKWYRPWALTAKWARWKLAERHVTPWVLKTDVWLRPIGVEPETVKALKKGLQHLGRGTGVHWYQWHQIPYDTDYPDFLPEKPGFKDLVADAQSLGAHVTPYINGRLWDPTNHTYQEYNGAEASCRRSDGTLYTEIYGSKVLNTVTCPASPIWQKVQHDLQKQILDSLGVDGIYMDQVGAAKGEACYAENHPHPKGGGEWWHDSYRKMIQDIRSEVYAEDKGITTEENGECYIDLFDMMLIVNSPHDPSVEMVPLFPLIYSDRCVYSGFTYQPEVLNDGSFDYMTMKSLLWGAHLGWVTPEAIMDKENSSPAYFLAKLAKFRKSAHDIFEGGHFLGEFVPGGDNPTKDIPGYQKTHMIMGAIWETVKGRKVYVIVNMDSSEHQVKLPDGRNIVVLSRDAKRQWK
ncbi:MAG: glycoside hydrolase [Bacteroidales bacterium]|nr:glycoside hydrolase [Bacteroidales bacterium]